jgi:hypothetical protein
MTSITRIVPKLLVALITSSGTLAQSAANGRASSPSPNVSGAATAPVAASGLLFRAPAAAEQQGYIDQRGELVIPYKFAHAFPFGDDGFALVAIGPKGGKDYPSGKPAIINRKGEVLHSGGTFIRPLGRGRFAVGQENGVRFISLGGEKFDVIVKCTSAYGPASEGKIPFEVGEKWGFLDDSGRVAIEPRFDSAGLFSEGLASADEGEKSGYIDHEGNWVIPPEFDMAFPFREGLGAVVAGGRAWYIDRTGKRAIAGDHMQADPFSEGLGLVELAKPPRLKGYLDKSGRFRIPAAFSIARPFKEGLAFVKNDRGEAGYIDHTGEMVIRLPDNCISQVDFENGVALIVTRDKIGYIDRTGAWVWVPPQVGPQEPFDRAQHDRETNGAAPP